MIDDKIKFKPGFAKEDAAYYRFAEVESEASDSEGFGSDLEVMLGNLVKWSERHD